ncbi:MAG: glycosyltransferase family 2 protein [Planctomycetota bacterium]|nr:glycosyltransferase family 2 protein [Planctomycetota bacterium]MDI6786950.1 glycosyltransferase family 2 protein [Planctomycetota bacterium]
MNANCEWSRQSGTNGDPESSSGPKSPPIRASPRRANLAPKGGRLAPEGGGEIQNPISVCIVCFNEESNIRRCLESVKWVKEYGGEIVIVDSFSTDKTVEICREYTDKVFQNPWPGFVKQKNYALSLAQNDWVLSIDADEVISDQLRDKILSEWKDGSYSTNPDPSDPDGSSGRGPGTGNKYDAFRMKRHTFYLGRWINYGGWYPDYKIRLFRKSKGRWGGRDPHDRVIMDDNTAIKNLHYDILHYTYKNLSHQLRTIDRFSDVSSEALMGEGRRFSLFNLLFRPPVKFIETYFIKLGFLDGLAGLIIAVASSFYVFVKYAKMWEHQNQKTKERKD